MFIGIGLPITGNLPQEPGVSIPDWVARTADGAAAIFDMDAANGRFWGASAEFEDEALFLDAINGSGADGKYLIGPYLDPAGVNILTNGGFDEDVEGWTAGAGIATLEWEDGEAKLTLANGSYPNLNQQIGYQGRAFLLSAKGRRGTSSNSFYLYAGIQAAMSGGTAVAPTTQTIDSTSPKTASGLFATYLASTFLGLRSTSATASGTAFFDDISAIEAWPLPGWQQRNFAVVLQATAPASISEDETLWQADASSPGAISAEQNRFRIYRKASDKHLIVDVTVIAGNQVSIDLGEVADEEQFSVAASFAPNNVTASLNGGAPVTDNSALLPGAAIMRLGQKFSGGQWGGSIERVIVF
jgi:hypothetical protein